MKPLIILSTGRSGTRYTAQVLRQCGLDFGHEQFRPDGLIAWFLAARQERNMLKLKQYTDPIILHQTRHPLNVIASWCQVFTKKPNYDFGNLSCLFEFRKEMPPLQKACLFYCKWIQLIHTFDIVYEYQVEYFDEALKDIANMADFDYQHPTISPDIGSSTPPPVAWKQIEESLPLLYYPLKAIAQDLGYDQQGDISWHSLRTNFNLISPN